MATNNFFSWFESSPKNRELSDTRSSWEAVERLWSASPLREKHAEDMADALIAEVMEDQKRIPAAGVIEAFGECATALFRAEDIGDIEVRWTLVESEVEAAIAVREMIARRRRWVTDTDRLLDAFTLYLSQAFRALLKSLPEACFGDWEKAGRESFGVPLIDLLDEPAAVIEKLIGFPFSDAPLSLSLFEKLKVELRRNIFAASGIDPHKSADSTRPVVPPTAQDGKSARELADLYLKGTPFADLLELRIPFAIPMESRFEHCHVIAGTGHGKTQLLQKMIHDDLLAAEVDGRSVVVIDSQGDLIRKISNLELFSPFVGGGLGERLILIDPSDVAHPFAMNLFDPHLARLDAYSPVDRERMLNGVIELYETFFDALLGAELTQRQDVVFRYIARLMLTIPGATIHTFLELMENGKAFTGYMEKLEGTARRFFEREFFSPSFSATKGQVAKRLWGVLSTPSFDRMFSQKENRIDLFEAMNGGKIILVNTAKDLLKDEGCRLFGRFFMAMLVQATLERSTVPEAKRTPAFVYADEAHEYFDDRIETVLNQARKFKVSLTLAHQNLDQLSPRLRAALLSNTTTKCAGGVSAKDARVLADELHTTTEFIDSMRRKGPQTEFAAWVKHVTPHAIRLTVPLGFLERQHMLDEEDFEELIRRNRERYCGSLADAAREAEVQSAEPESEAPIETAVPSAPVPVVRQTVAHAPIAAPAAPGKGGPKHRYLQSLIKELAEGMGLKATLEATLHRGGGQVDVLVERDGVLAAIEISVSTPIEHERANVRKCFDAGYPRVALVLTKSKDARSRYADAILSTLTDAERERLSFLTPEDLPDYIAALAPVPERVETVKGYRVRVSQGSSTPEDARKRREAVASVLARSLRRTAD